MVVFKNDSVYDMASFNFTYFFMSQENMSLWEETKPINLDNLEKNEAADVCIIGGGIAGLSVAYELLQKGKSVVVVEGKEIGAGETGRTTAHLSNALDEGFVKLQKMFGVAGAKLAAQSHTAAIDWIERIVQTEKIDCDFERVGGYLLGTNTGALEAELEAAHESGLVDVLFEKESPIDPKSASLFFPQQAQFHPQKYLNGLAAAIIKKGGKIYTNTFVKDVQEKEAVVVTTKDDITITCQSAVVATNTPFLNTFAIHTKQAAYRSYVLGLSIPQGSVSKALYWDTEDPYHYVRVCNGDHEDVLLVGGEDHKTGQANNADQRFDHLLTWAKQKFPMAGEIKFSWSGQVMEPIDGLAFIGLNPGNKYVYIVTGDSGHGLTHGTIAGMLISDLIVGTENTWEKLYDPSRKNVHAFGQFFKESCNVALQYTKLVSKGDVQSESEIKPGSGAIIKKGLKKIATYKDEQGNVHQCSALCPHLGCVVAWNGGEKTWDCPCHGSRFTAQGKVLNGPATQDLPSL